MRALNSWLTLILCLLILWLPGSQSAAEDKFARGLSLFNKQAYAEALQIFNEMSGSGDREAQRLYYAALCYLHTARSREAEELLTRICRDFPASEAAGLADRYLKASKAAVARVPAAPPAETSLQPVEISIPFTKTARGQLTVRAELHGCSMNMIFDTGAEECLFGRNQIEAANLKTAEHSKPATLNSVAGPMRVFRIFADISLNGFKKSLPICVLDQDMEAGILGQPFLSGYSCVIDNQAGLLRLRATGNAGSSASLDSFAVPFTLDGDKIIVRARLKGRSLDMCFDTGSFGVCLTRSQCEHLGVKVPDSAAEHTRGPDGQQVESWHINEDISLGPINKKAFPIRVVDSQISYPLLGQSFFGDRTFNIDRDRKEIRFAR
jgi:predicted aspartyl protease